MRLILLSFCLTVAASSFGQPLLTDNPPRCATAQACAGGDGAEPVFGPTSCSDQAVDSEPAELTPQTSSVPDTPLPSQRPARTTKTPVDKNGNPIPIERLQPQRILGFMPNFRSVSGGEAAHPPGFKYNFVVATRQAFDYSSFIFLGLTSLTAEATDEHTALGKGIEGFSLYTWRGFVDKTDNTYLSAWFLPTLLREDTRYYALGTGHRIDVRALYVISQQAVARSYRGHLTPNLAGLGGKAITQYVSRYYYPPSAGTFGVLATKFGYSVMRDVAFSSVREFYPDIAAHYVRKHQEKQARLAARRASAQAARSAQGTNAPPK
ncbi:MAG: hypothetical protein ACLGXA_16705 [Acidobacteriota bacterium]